MRRRALGTATSATMTVMRRARPLAAAPIASGRSGLGPVKLSPVPPAAPAPPPPRHPPPTPTQATTRIRSSRVLPGVSRGTATRRRPRPRGPAMAGSWPATTPCIRRCGPMRRPWTPCRGWTRAFFLASAGNPPLLLLRPRPRPTDTALLGRDVVGALRCCLQDGHAAGSPLARQAGQCQRGGSLHRSVVIETLLEDLARLALDTPRRLAVVGKTKNLSYLGFSSPSQRPFLTSAESPQRSRAESLRRGPPQAVQRAGETDDFALAANRRSHTLRPDAGERPSPAPTCPCLKLGAG